MQDKMHYLRQTFDQEAELYDDARPGYPDALFDDVVSLSGLPARGRVLEIGCGTGQATVPMAQRGYRILGIELGAHLAAVARHKLVGYPQAQIYTGSFEAWPAEVEAFDLALSATAFHWIDPTISYQKTAQVLKPTGAIALCWHVHVQSEASQGFFEAVQPIYQREVPEQETSFKSLPWPDEVGEPVRAEIEQNGLFGEVTVRRYCWDVAYDTASYLRLLSTYSGHRVLDSQRRARLFQAIAELIDTQFHGHITKGDLAILYVAQRK